MTNPSTSDLAKLFIALGEQAKAGAESRGTRFASEGLVKQFNLLAETAKNAVNINSIALIEGNGPEYLSDLVAKANIAAEIVRMYDGASVIDVQSAVIVPGDSITAVNPAPKPRVFIGCSVEGIGYAKIIQLQLKDATRTTIWSQGVFGLSRGTLETLVAERCNYDYAILVLTPDDTRMKRNQEGSVPRDNVIFELGLFMGALGRENVFMVVQKSTELPTDLAGITPAVFDPEEDMNIVSVLGPVATMLELAMDLI